ncbi:MAG: hypothetical protein ACHP93_02120 [Solirubrobacterales bacterium]
MVVGVLVVDMTGRAVRIADSNHTPEAAFVATAPGGATVCQPIPPPPPDAATARLLIGTYGRPLPDLAVRFVSPTGAVTARGELAGGGSQGHVDIPFKRERGNAQATNICVQNLGRSKIAIAGVGVPPGPGSERVDGTPAPGAISITLFRAGRESWWSLLGALDRRFTLGKAGLLGGWTFPICALMLLGVWVTVVRLLVREAR